MVDLIGIEVSLGIITQQYLPVSPRNLQPQKKQIREFVPNLVVEVVVGSANIG